MINLVHMCVACVWVDLVYILLESNSTARHSYLLYVYMYVYHKCFMYRFSWPMATYICSCFVPNLHLLAAMLLSSGT